MDSDSISQIKFTPTKDATLSFDWYHETGNFYIDLYDNSGNINSLLESSHGDAGSVTDVSLTAGVTYTLKVWFSDMFDYGDVYAYIDNLKIEWLNVRKK